uniref:Uncharacterized protein n=1 Tax=Ciona savignyi TaxID=51511 RepID=H2ZJ52_CIOSA
MQVGMISNYLIIMIDYLKYGCQGAINRVIVQLST